MSLRIRYGTGSFLLMMALIAVCSGWAADRAWLQRQRRMMDQWESVYLKRGKELTFALKVNEELRNENKKLRAKLRENGISL